MQKRKVSGRLWASMAAVLCVILLFFAHYGKKKEIILEFGMFTGSN